MHSDISFKSGFSEKLSKFVSQKHSLGFEYEKSCKHLQKFDLMCAKRFPNENLLTKEICTAWATRHPGEGNNYLRNRIIPIREFARFLMQNGERAYFTPIRQIRKVVAAAPYIFTKDEITSIFHEMDTLPIIPYLPNRHIVLPAFIRVLYCCGLRPIEACRLVPADVCLDTGKLIIRESKGHQGRILMMPQDLTGYIRKYDKAMVKIEKNRKFFFPNVRGNFYDNRCINHVLRKVLKKLKISKICGKAPSLYSFRHTFATHRLYDWMNDGEDLRAKLPYLSTYMGHTQISNTDYYIHLVPEQLTMLAGIDFSRYEYLLPEVGACE